MSLPKKIVAPKIRWKAPTRPRYLSTALLHGERVQHLRGALERDPRIPLANGERRQKYGDEAILAPRKSIAGVPGDLQHELPVTAFVEQTPHIGSLHRQTAEDKRPR